MQHFFIGAYLVLRFLFFFSSTGNQSLCDSATLSGFGSREETVTETKALDLGVVINAAFRWYQDPASATLELRLEVWSFVAGLCELPLRLSWEPQPQRL